MHIHIDCVKTEVRRKLSEQTFTSKAWSSVSLEGRVYRVKFIAGEELSINPIQLLHEDVPQEEMAHHSLVVLGSATPHGFFILDTNGNRAHGEDLQDHSECPSE